MNYAELEYKLCWKVLSLTHASPLGLVCCADHEGDSHDISRVTHIRRMSIPSGMINQTEANGYSWIGLPFRNDAEGLL
jgi:hypothetical protein